MLEFLTLTLFSVANAVRLLAYIPQIVRAARDTNGASAVSFTTWLLFFVSHLATIAYALINLKDPVVALVFTGNALACLAVVGVTFWKRRRHEQIQERAGKAHIGAAELPQAAARRSQAG